MGIVRAEITLFNALDMALYRRNQLTKEQVKSIKVTCLVDSGAYMLVIPEKIRLQLGLQIISYELAEFANGLQEKVAITEPIEVHFENRKATVDALVTGNEVLLGAIPMEALDIVIHPKEQKLSVNPEHPNIAVFRV